MTRLQKRQEGVKKGDLKMTFSLKRVEHLLSLFAEVQEVMLIDKSFEKEVFFVIQNLG